MHLSCNYKAEGPDTKVEFQSVSEVPVFVQDIKDRKKVSYKHSASESFGAIA